MKKILFIILTTILCLVTILPCYGANNTEKDAALISHGLQVIASKHSMAKAALIGGNLEIRTDDFLRSLNLSKINGVEISAVPAETDGKLMLGNICVVNGQHISSANLDLLQFVPASTSVTSSKFTFLTEYGCNIDFNIYFLNKVNYCPSTENVIFTSLNVETYKNTELYGRLFAKDTEHDEIRFEIVSYPSHGSLQFTDEKNGAYIYTPLANDTGKEKFSYVVCDKYGNYSAACEVTIIVKKGQTSISYADLDNNPAENCAIELTERNIMSGTQVGNIYYFYPQQNISRAEFLTMTLQCAEIEPQTNIKECIFTDIDSITDNMRDYVKTALKVGVLNGLYISDEPCEFSPDEPICRAEAAVIVNNILKIKNKAISEISINTSSVSKKTVPVWAEDAMYALASLDMMQITGNDIPGGSDNLTRGECAQMLMQLIRILDN